MSSNHWNISNFKSWQKKAKENWTHWYIHCQEVKRWLLSQPCRHLGIAFQADHVIIENKAGLMINFILEIGERKTSLTWFDIKVKNKKGEEETFPPSRLHIKTTVTGSHNIQDIEEFKTIMKGYQDLVGTLPFKLSTLRLKPMTTNSKMMHLTPS